MSDNKIAEIRARHEAGERGSAVEDREWLLAEVERQARHIEELQQKVDAEKSCACSYDEPGDVCHAHSPALAKALAEIERLREALGWYGERARVLHLVVYPETLVPAPVCSTLKATAKIYPFSDLFDDAGKRARKALEDGR